MQSNKPHQMSSGWQQAILISGLLIPLYWLPAGPMAWGEVGGAKAMCAVLRDSLLGISWLSGKVKMWDHFGNGKGIFPFPFFTQAGLTVFSLCWLLMPAFSAHTWKSVGGVSFLFLMLILAGLTAIFSSTADPLHFTVDDSFSVCAKRSSHCVVMR